MPVLCYRDVATAIDWLCQTLGFERQRVATADDGIVQFAHLAFGGEVVMLTPAVATDDRDGDQPARAASVVDVQSCYFIVEDVETHCARARAAGAEIIQDIARYEHGGQVYSCRDPEGHVWSFGSYDPWREARGGLRSRSRSAMSLGRAFMTAMLLLAAGVGTIGWTIQQRSAADNANLSARAAIAAEQRAKAATELADRQAAELASLQAAKETADNTLQQLRQALAREQGARQSAERVADTMRQQLTSELEQLRAAKDSVLETASVLRDQLARAEDARLSAERGAHAAQQQLEELRRERAAATPPTSDAQAQRRPVIERGQVQSPEAPRSPSTDVRDSKPTAPSIASEPAYAAVGAAPQREEQTPTKSATPPAVEDADVPRTVGASERGEVAPVDVGARKDAATQDTERKPAPVQRALRPAHTAKEAAQGPQPPARIANRPLTARERQLRIERAKARCRALYPNSPCDVGGY